MAIQDRHPKHLRKAQAMVRASVQTRVRGLATAEGQAFFLVSMGTLAAEGDKPVVAATVLEEEDPAVAEVQVTRCMKSISERVYCRNPNRNSPKRHAAIRSPAP